MKGKGVEGRKGFAKSDATVGLEENGNFENNKRFFFADLFGLYLIGVQSWGSYVGLKALLGLNAL